MKIRNILFDLDGTLSDLAVGIIRCIQHSTATLNRICPPAEELAHLGPPLREGMFALHDELLLGIANELKRIMLFRAVNDTALLPMTPFEGLSFSGANPSPLDQLSSMLQPAK